MNPNGHYFFSGNLYAALEARRRFILTSLLIVTSGILFVTALRNPVDYDGYWHLAMGRDLLEHGLSPFRDHYSFTFNNAEVRSPPWLFQSFLYMCVYVFGEQGGFIAVKLIAMFALVGCMLAWLKQIKAPIAIYLLVFPFLILLIQLRAQVRPELFSYTFSIIALMLYHRADLRLSATAIAPVAILLFLWSNYHSAVLGYVIFFGLFVDIAIRLVREKAAASSWGSWASWGIVLVGAGFLTPDFSHPVLNTLLMADDWKALIQEYRSPLAAYSSLWSFYLLAAVAVATLVLSLLNRQIGYFVGCLVLLYASATMSRMVTPAGIILLCLFAHTATDYALGKPGIFRLSWASNTWVKNTTKVAALGFGLVPLWESVVFARSAMFSNQSYAAMFPKHLVSYMQREGKSGRIFNEYAMGGYLIYHLSPSSQVFIDGRTGILYPVGHYLNWFFTKHDSDRLNDIIDSKAIDFVLLSNNPGMAQHMANISQIALDFADERFFLYSNESASFSTIGKLWARPYCLGALNRDQLLREWEYAEKTLPPTSPVMQITSLATGYISTVNPLDWLQKMPLDLPWNDDARRFAAYRALEHNANEQAITLFNSISSRLVKDDLALALAYTRKGQWDDAEKMMDLAVTRPEWTYEYRDTVIMGRLLSYIQNQRPLRKPDRAFLDKISSRAGFSRQQGSHLIDFRDFCDNFPEY